MYTVHIDDVAQALYLTSLWLMATDRKEQLKVAGTDVPFSFAAPTSRFSVGALKKSPSFSDMWETVEGVVPESTTVTIPMFNVIDENNSTQQSLAAAVAGVWGIKYGFVGSTVTSLVERFAKADFNDMIDDVNEKVRETQHLTEY
jgi:hypothetical protein